MDVSEITDVWMPKALELARQAAWVDEVPIGALIVRRGEILGRGFNFREQSKRTVAHAEIMALEDFAQRFGQWRLPPDSALVVTTEPCLMCTGALLWARADHLYYGCRDPKNAGLNLIEPYIELGTFDHRFATIQGAIREEECSVLLSEYFRQKRLQKGLTSPLSAN